MDVLETHPQAGDLTFIELCSADLSPRPKTKNRRAPSGAHQDNSAPRSQFCPGSQTRAPHPRGELLQGAGKAGKN